MNKMNNMTDFTASMANLTNGAFTDYTLSITTNNIPIKNTDLLYLTFPPEISVPSSTVCTPVSGIIKMSCSNSGNNMVIKMT
jgi:hypothetical protein